MNLLKNLRISARLALGFGALLLAATALVAFTAHELSGMQVSVRTLVEQDWVKAADAATIEATTRDNARNTMELFFADEAGARAIRQRIADNRGRIDRALDSLQRLVRRPEGQRALASLAATRRDYVASFSRVDALLREGDADGARRLLTTQTLPTLDALQRHVAELAALQTRLAREAGAQMLREAERARQVLLAAGLAMLGLGVLATWAISRSIVQPICRAVTVAEAVAAGRLGQRLAIGEGGETGRLMRALDGMNQSLVQLVERVRGASEGIATGSHQIAGGTADLSQRTEEQAANLQQTAASMEELAGAVRQNAASAQQANALAQGASAAAEDGGSLMSEVSAAMGDIGEASRRIEEISAVIDGIAFQTNLLALNAAVEAARAGEHGRGFAVVAAEVRALSRRSGDAAREIRGLIQHSSERVARGGGSVERAQRQIGQIVDRVREVSDTLAHISAAAGEQTRGIEQVNLAVAQLDQVTQQNAALVEQSAAASDSLDEQARRLLQAVGVFALEPAAAQPA